MAVDLVQDVLIGGRYRLERCLGMGGMGAVWQAKHEVTGRRHALKFVTSRGAAPPELAKRFLREARAASTVDHPNVVHVADVFELDDGTPVMVMDLLEGETLAQRLSRERKLPLAEVADLMLPVISAVGTAHAYSVVHRDLKPDNIFLARTNGGRPRVFVLDFGIAKLTGDGVEADGTLTQAGTLLGTPRYMSPEQSFGERGIDHRTDLWSLGVILYEALSGCRPVEGENIAQIVKRLMNDGITPIDALLDLPEDISTLIGKLLSRDREQRPTDLREVFEVLRRYATVDAATFGPPASRTRGEESHGGEERAPAAIALSPQYEPARSRRKPSLTLVAIVVALVGGVVLGIAVSSRSDSVDPPKSEPLEPAKHVTPPRETQARIAPQQTGGATPAHAEPPSAAAAETSPTTERAPPSQRPRTSRRAPTSAPTASSAPSAQEAPAADKRRGLVQKAPF